MKSLAADALSLDTEYVEERVRTLALTVAAGTSQRAGVCRIA